MMGLARLRDCLPFVSAMPASWLDCTTVQCQRRCMRQPRRPNFRNMGGSWQQRGRRWVGHRSSKTRTRGYMRCVRVCALMTPRCLISTSSPSPRISTMPTIMPANAFARCPNWKFITENFLTRILWCGTATRSHVAGRRPVCSCPQNRRGLPNHVAACVEKSSRRVLKSARRCCPRR